MIDFRFTPKTSGKREKITTVLYASLALVALIFGFINIPGKGFIQLISVVFLVLALTNYIKYFLTSYTYTLTEEYEDAMLVVTQTQGKRISTLANFRISDIKSIEKKEKETLNKYILEKFGTSCVKYNYCVGNDSEYAILVVVKSDYTRNIVSFSFNEEFYKVLCEIYDQYSIESDIQE